MDLFDHYEAEHGVPEVRYEKPLQPNPARLEEARRLKREAYRRRRTA